MVKFFTDIIGSRVLLFQERAQIGPAADVIIDPADGAFLGISVLDSVEKRKKVIPASEIKGFGTGFVLARDFKSLTEIDDVVRIKKVIEDDVNILGAKVETESGQKLGKVENATIDLKLLALEKLYVNPPLSISFLSTQLIIPSAKIIEIQKKKIIVGDEFAKVKKKVTESQIMPVVE